MTHDPRTPPRRAFSIRDALRDVWVAPASQIPALDALRVIAILMVIAGHFSGLGKEQFPAHGEFFGRALFEFGWTGVDLFFVLSGFLIGGQLWKEVKRSGTIDVRRFILRRGLRIWPLYFVVVLLSPALVAHWSYKWGDWTFLSNYVAGRVEGGWSLSTEEQFYILAPLAILVGSRFLRVRGWLAVFASALALVAGLRWWTARGLLHAGMSVANVKTRMYTPFHLHNEGLIIGLVIALVFVTHPSLFDGAGAHRRRIFGVALAASTLALVLRATNGTVFPFLALALLYGSATVSLLTVRPAQLAALRVPPIYSLSRLSYGMYLNHFAVLRWIGPFIARGAKAVAGQSPVAICLTVVGVMVMSALVALVTFVIVEHPFLVIRARHFSSPPRPTVPHAAAHHAHAGRA